MSRILNLNEVIKVCAVDPDVVPHLKALSHTGKRGRPSSKVKAFKVERVLKKHKAVTALKLLSEMA
jgi:hypothetical protein